MLTKLLFNPTILKLIFRHALTALGAYLATKGILSGTQWEDALGAASVLGSTLLSIWNKRAIIQADLQSVEKSLSGGQLPLLVALLLPFAFSVTVQAQTTNGFWSDVSKVGEDAYSDLILPLQLDTNDIVSFSAGAGVNTANNRPVVALTATVPVSTYASVGFVGAYGNNSWYEGGVNLTLGITNTLPLIGQCQEFAGDGAVYDFRTSAVANYSFSGIEKSWQVNPSLVLAVGAIIANTSDQPGVDVIGGGNVTWHF